MNAARVEGFDWTAPAAFLLELTRTFAVAVDYTARVAVAVAVLSTLGGC